MRGQFAGESSGFPRKAIVQEGAICFRIMASLQSEGACFERRLL